MKYEVEPGRKFDVVVIVIKEKGGVAKIVGAVVVVALLGLFGFGAYGAVTGDYHVFDTLGKVASQAAARAAKGDDGRKD